MSALSQMAWIVFMIAGFVCFIYSWFILATVSDKPFRWRERFSLLALIVVSVAILLRFVMPAFWGSDFGEQVRVAQVWTKVSVRMCALALLFGLAGRFRLILPLIVACLAAASFWVMSTIP